MLYGVVVVLCLSELLDCLESRHGPVGQLPCLWPPDIHVLRAYDHDNYFKVVVTNAGAQAGSCVGSDAGLHPVDASLAEHLVRVVPLVGAFVAVGIFLDGIELGAHHLSELLELHGLTCQFGYVDGRGLVVGV